MKKVILLSIFTFIFFIFIFCILNFLLSYKNHTYKNNSFSEEKTKILYSFDFSKNDIQKSEADKILWYVLFTEYSLMKSGQDDFSTFNPDSVLAFKADIDDDGENEIIGTCKSSLFWGSESGIFFILKKMKDDYKIFTTFTVDNGYDKIYVLKSKTGKFHNLIIEDKYRNNYIHGKFEKGSQNLIMLKGLCASILPFRFNCTPEIVVVEISGNTIDEEKLTYQYRFSLLDKIFPKRNKVIKSFKITRDIAKHNHEAENIFWQKLKKSFDVSDLNDEEIYEKTGLTRNNQIILFDLDGDSQDEIIGINKSQICWGHMNYGLLILKKKGNNYEIISDITVRVEHDEIKILEHKTNGFYDIKLSNAENDVPEKILAFY